MDLSGLSLLLFLIALLSHRSNFTGPLFQIIMFGMGSQMSYRDFAGVILMPKGVLVGLVCQFTIMPIIGFTIATMLAPLITPSLMKLLAGQFVPIDFWAMMLSIINIVILPIVAGLMFNTMAYGKDKLRNKILQGVVYLLIITGKNLILFQTSELETGAAFAQFGKDVLWFLVLPIVAAGLFKKVAGGNKAALDKVMAFLSMAGIGIIILVITAAGRDSLLEIGFLLILACFLHNSAGYFLGYWICKLARMDEKSCHTIALEVGMQNGGLASGIALQMGRVATIGLAPAVFGPMMNITGSSLATWWRRNSENI